jgi:hypothetical protein
MDTRKYGAGFIKPDDVRDGPRQEKIVKVSVSEKFDALEIELASGEQLTLNNTNTRVLNRAYTTESDNWLGQTIELSLGHYTDFRDGKEKETVVVRPISVRQPSSDNGGAQTEPSVLRRDDLDDEIPF